MALKIVYVDAFTGETEERELTENELSELESIRAELATEDL